MAKSQTCPGSGRSGAGILKYIGKKIGCPNCGRSITVTKEGKLRVHTRPY